MKTLKLKDGLNFYEVEGLTFHKFNNQQEVEEFLTTNEIEDRTGGEYPISEILNSYGDTFFVYDNEEKTNALVIADEDTNQNWEIKYDYDEETFYASNSPAFWGQQYEETLVWALDAFNFEPQRGGGLNE